MASNPGMGVMIGMLGGNEASAKAVQGALGKTLSYAELRDDALFLSFDDGTGIRLADEGQSCCEHRYMRTDDTLTDYAGAKLLDIELREAPTVEGEYGEMSEVQFLAVKTDKGEFVMSSHNEHNGYYGGFWIVASEV